MMWTEEHGRRLVDMAVVSPYVVGSGRITSIPKVPTVG